MMKTLCILLKTICSAFKTHTDLALENLALRQQLSVLKAAAKRPRVRTRDRVFWVLLSRFWKNWDKSLVIVKPETVVRWNRKGFKLFWKRKSRCRGPGRPPVSKEIRDLVRRMVQANVGWGAPRIHGELLKLGIEISERTVSNLIGRYRRKSPSQTWRSFIENHMPDMCGMDSFIVPTATFRVLFVLVILFHDRRRIVHFNVTEHPHAEWTAQQVVDAFPWDEAPRYLIRDRDGIYGGCFRRRVRAMEITEVVIARKSPWQNPYAERLIGSIRRDCLDHVIVLDERHLKRILRSYFHYYHEDRSHLGLEKDTPLGRPVKNRPSGPAEVIALPRVGGLHNRYEWKQAA